MPDDAWPAAHVGTVRYMSESEKDTEQQASGQQTERIDDEQLPEDLQPTEDNPLAQPLDPDEAPDPEELDMQGGKPAAEWDGDDPED